MMSTILIVCAVSAAPLLIGSLVVCAPKWWRVTVEPRLGKWRPRVPGVLSTDVTTPVLHGKASDRARLVLYSPIIILVSVVAVVVSIVVAMFEASFALIEGACPYSDPNETPWRNRMRLLPHDPMRALWDYDHVVSMELRHRAEQPAP